MGTCVTQLVKCLTLGFRPGHDLRVVRSASASAQDMEPAWDSLFSSPSTPAPQNTLYMNVYCQVIIAKT